MTGTSHAHYETINTGTDQMACVLTTVFSSSECCLLGETDKLGGLDFNSVIGHLRSRCRRSVSPGKYLC